MNLIFPYDFSVMIWLFFLNFPLIFHQRPAWFYFGKPWENIMEINDWMIWSLRFTPVNPGEWFQGGYAPNIFFSAAQSWYRAIMIEVMMMVSWWEVVLPWGWFQFEPSQFVLFHDTGFWTLLTWRIVMKLMMLYDVVGKSHREIILTSMPIENCHL
jgi:hypothetical protein